MAERFAPKSLRSAEELNSVEWLGNQAARVANDIDPKAKEAFSPMIIKRVNDLVCKARTPSQLQRLEKAGLVLGRLPTAAYSPGGEKCYYSRTHNGRPDFILKDKHGHIVGVVEVKRRGKTMTTKNKLAYLKQAINYKLLFSAAECYLVYLGLAKNGCTDTIETPTDDEIQVVEGTVEVMLHNIDLFNKTIITYGSKID